MEEQEGMGGVEDDWAIPLPDLHVPSVTLNVCPQALLPAPNSPGHVGLGTLVSPWVIPALVTELLFFQPWYTITA